MPRFSNVIQLTTSFFYQFQFDSNDGHSMAPLTGPQMGYSSLAGTHPSHSAPFHPTMNPTQSVGHGTEAQEQLRKSLRAGGPVHLRTGYIQSGLGKFNWKFLHKENM